ncbi:MAG: retroviral-like aspartic protease family protein [Betaproteobacteria bacterium]|nr:MAG: retroviral-like aspartic protease family protein [Betaproteobacteria bacterium]
MNGHVTAAIVWVAIVIAGYFVIDHFSAPDPVVRTTQSGGYQITIPVARDGHFYLEGAINGQQVTFLVDTGASYVSVGSDVARRANLPEGVTGVFSTANGSVEGRIVRRQSVRADVFEISGISVAVMPGSSPYGLLGQNFLRHFSVSQSDGKLVLRMRQS